MFVLQVLFQKNNYAKMAGKKLNVLIQPNKNSVVQN